MIFFRFRHKFKFVILAICTYCLATSFVYSDDNNPEIQRAVNSLINKQYMDAGYVFNNEMRKYKVSVLKNLKTLLTGYKFFDEEKISENVLSSQEELDFIRKTAIYKSLVNRITRNLEDDREIVLALFDWTVRNITFVGNKEAGEVLNAFPYDYMKRGFGCCDRSAWVFAVLAYQAGYHAHVISMPYHAMAQVFIENDWKLFDPHYNIIYKNNKNLLGLNNLDEIKSIIDKNNYYSDVSNFRTDLPKSNLVTICEPWSVLPKMKTLQYILDKNVANPPRVYFDIFDELAFTIKTMSSNKTKVDGPYTIPYLIPDKKFVVMIWLYPFSIKNHYKKGIYHANLEKLYPELDYLDKGRELQITGEFEKAIKEYKKQLNIFSDRNMQEDITYNMALCYYELEEYKQSGSLLEKYKKEFSDGDEIRGVDRLLKKINDKIGKNSR